MRIIALISKSLVFEYFTQLQFAGQHEIYDHEYG